MFGSSRKKNEEGFGSREHDVTQTSSLISTRPKHPSCFQPDPNLPPVLDPSQTSFLPVFYPTQAYLKQSNKKGKQTSRHTNQKEKYTILT